MNPQSPNKPVPTAEELIAAECATETARLRVDRARLVVENQKLREANAGLAETIQKLQKPAEAVTPPAPVNIQTRRRRGPRVKPNGSLQPSSVSTTA